MTIEEKKEQYQRILNAEYRREYPELTEGRTDEEVTLMNPLASSDFIAFVYAEISGIKAEITILEKEKEADEETIENAKNGSRSYGEMISELRSDIMNNTIKIRMLNEKLAEFERMLQEVYEEEYDTGISR